MCTLTFVPSKEQGGFILTSNRDELVSRSKALFPASKEMGGKQILFPQDEKGGSWIASSSDRTVCLLNGGFQKHIPSPPYRMSRGLVVLNTFGLKELSEYQDNKAFEGIEPFTLVCIVHHDQLSIKEFVWTGKQIYFDEKPGNKPYIWSSVTLYSPEEITRKQQYFQQWLAQQQEPSPEQLRNLHQEKFEGESKGFSINIEGKVLTVSITSVVKERGEVRMYYQELFEHSSPLVERIK